MKRLVEFLRSVMPRDSFQLVYLLGVVCLFVSPRLPWWPVEFLNSTDHLPSSVDGTEFSRFIVFFLWPITLAGLVGYFLCFWPGRNQVRWVLLGVCLPSIIGITLIASRILSLGAPFSSVLSKGSHGGHQINSFLFNIGKFPPGFHFCVVGLILILFFLSRQVFGISAMPLALDGTPVSGSEDSGSWQRTQFLIWVLIGPLFLLMSLPAFLIIWAASVFSSQVPGLLQSTWYGGLGFALDGLLLLGIVLLIAGREGRQTIRGWLRSPNRRFVVIALLIPTGISLFLPTTQYLIDRAHWAAYEFGKFAPPQFNSYFILPDGWLLFMSVAALAEEIIFRGLLQPKLVGRYGLHRGIVLTSVIWASIHFRSDKYSHLTDSSIVFQLISRVCICLALGYVLAWLTLWSGSVFPAAICHTISNVLLYSGLQVRFPWSGALRILLWSVCAFLLFRHWPVPEAAASPPNAPVTDLEPTV